MKPKRFRGRRSRPSVIVPERQQLLDKRVTPRRPSGGRAAPSAVLSPAERRMLTEGQHTRRGKPSYQLPPEARTGKPGSGYVRPWRQAEPWAKRAERAAKAATAAAKLTPAGRGARAAARAARWAQYVVYKPEDGRQDDWRSSEGRTDHVSDATEAFWRPPDDAFQQTVNDLDPGTEWSPGNPWAVRFTPDDPSEFGSIDPFFFRSRSWYRRASILDRPLEQFDPRNDGAPNGVADPGAASSLPEVWSLSPGWSPFAHPGDTPSPVEIATPRVDPNNSTRWWPDPYDNVSFSPRRKPTFRGGQRVTVTMTGDGPPIVRHSYGPPSRGKNKNEKKAQLSFQGMQTIKRIINSIGEGAEVVNLILDATTGFRESDGAFGNYDKSLTDAVARWIAMEGWKDFQPGEFLEALRENDVEDTVFGTAGQKSAEGSKALGSTFGVQTGKAL